MSAPPKRRQCQQQKGKPKPTRQDVFTPTTDLSTRFRPPRIAVHHGDGDDDVDAHDRLVTRANGGPPPNIPDPSVTSLHCVGSILATLAENQRAGRIDRRRRRSGSSRIIQRNRRPPPPPLVSMYYSSFIWTSGLGGFISETARLPRRRRRASERAPRTVLCKRASERVV